MPSRGLFGRVQREVLALRTPKHYKVVPYNVHAASLLTCRTQTHEDGGGVQEDLVEEKEPGHEDGGAQRSDHHRPSCVEASDNGHAARTFLLGHASSPFT